MAGDDWSREEVEATVGDYFAMLRDELAGLPVNKSERNLRLRRLLQDRSKGSVEFKHANISAVLTLHGYPYIDGYKPRFNFQALLEQVVLEYLDVHRDFFEPVVMGPVLNPTTSPDPAILDTARLVELTPEAMRIPQTVWSPTTWLSRFDFVARDAANRDLGRRLRSSWLNSSASVYRMAAVGTSSNGSNGRPRSEATARVTTSSRSTPTGARA